MTLTPVEVRHHIHKNPEIAFQEIETTKFIEEQINKLAQKYNFNLKIFKPLETGLIVEYKKNDGEYTIFRADIDALAIDEDTECDFKSINGKMHACGHDIHCAILYGFLERVLQKNINKNILFVFQPAEEGGGGAKLMLDTGFFDNYKIDSAYAIHVTDDYPIGNIATKKGIIFASAMEINADFYGESAHCAFPHEGRNALNALRTFLDEVDRMPKNPEIPFVFAPGVVEAGEVRNIIPAIAKLKGTLRSLKAEYTEFYYNKLKEIADKSAKMHNCESQVYMGSFYAEVDNDEKLFEKHKNLFESKYNFKDAAFKFVGEDFGFFSKKYQSLLLWLGTLEDKKYGLHNKKFLPSDKVIEIGINAFEDIVESI